MGEVRRSGERQEADRMEGVEEGRRGGRVERGEERRRSGEE